MEWLEAGEMVRVVPLWVLRLAGGVGALGVCLLGALYAFQEKILYIPQIPGVPDEYINTPDDYRIQHEEVWLTSADGTKLHCWHLMPQPSPDGAKPPVILFFQENAGNMSHRLHYLALLVNRLSTAVFVLGYRGYGKSEGSPNQVGIEMDADAALQHVLKRTDVDTSKVVVLGKSLGGAVALHTAAKNESKLRGAVVENTFLSVEEMVPRVLPFLAFGFGPRRPLNFLLRSTWRNRDKICTLKQLPILMIGSKQDTLVPFSHMEGLKELVSTANTTWIECPNSGHMDAYETDRVLYWSSLSKFWEDNIV